MAFCVACGKEIKEGAKFCKYCGSKQPVPAILSEPAAESEAVETKEPTAENFENQGTDKAVKTVTASDEVVLVDTGNPDETITVSASLLTSNQPEPFMQSEISDQPETFMQSETADQPETFAENASSVQPDAAAENMAVNQPFMENPQCGTAPVAGSGKVEPKATAWRIALYVIGDILTMISFFYLLKGLNWVFLYTRLNTLDRVIFDIPEKIIPVFEYKADYVLSHITVQGIFGCWLLGLATVMVCTASNKAVRKKLRIIGTLTFTVCLMISAAHFVFNLEETDSFLGNGGLVQFAACFGPLVIGTVIGLIIKGIIKAVSKKKAK